LDTKLFGLHFEDSGVKVGDSIVEEILRAAIQAPTGRNGQPWRWHMRSNSIRLYCDDPDTLTDFQHCGAFAGLGAAIENLVLAAHHHGVEVKLALLPDPTQPMCAADISLLQRPNVETEPHAHDGLYDALGDRCTNRRRGDGTAIDSKDVTQLVAAVESVPGAQLRLHTARPAINDLASILGVAGCLQLFDENFQRELVSELRWTPAEAERTKDGVDVDTLELEARDRMGLSLCKSWTVVRLLRRCGGAKVIAPLFAEPVKACGAVGLIWMQGNSWRDYVKGGRALERAWLRATQLGLALHPMSTLPYFFARLIRGRGEAMSQAMRDGLRQLRSRYTEHFEVNDANGEIMSFCVSRAPAPSKRSLRKPLMEVVRAEP
jgi:hypothetical protein